MRQFLYASLLLAVSLNVATATPAKLVATNDHKIVGGEPAAAHEFPFIVDLTRPSHYCGGAVIAPKWIMTAAHCSQASASSYVIVAGDHEQTTWDGLEQRRQVVRVIPHPNYNSGTFDNDIALMELAVPLNFTDVVQPVRLPPRDFAPTGRSTVAGWGALSEGGGSPTTVYKVSVPLVSNADCNAAYNGNGYNILPSMICAGEGGKDSCQGDSGGPMLCESEDGQVQCGIVSWGVGCAREGFPGVYARVSQFLDWIAETTNGDVKV